MLLTLTPRASAHDPEGKGEDEQQKQRADDPIRRQRPFLLLLLPRPADPHQDADDFLAALRLGDPEAVVVSRKFEFAFAVGTSGEVRARGAAGREHLHRSIRQRLAVRRGKLHRDVVPRKQVECCFRRG
jgi:hypothetical protein